MDLAPCHQGIEDTAGTMVEEQRYSLLWAAAADRSVQGSPLPIAHVDPIDVEEGLTGIVGIPQREEPGNHRSVSVGASWE